MRHLKSIVLLLIFGFLLAGCGGGSGPSSEPAGVNPGYASDIQLLAVQQVVQTGATAFFKAKVLDGNGLALAGKTVTFTNLSGFGTLSSSSATTGSSGTAAAGSTGKNTKALSVNTDTLGYATVSVKSSIAGFVTLQAEINDGAGRVRDQRTIYFSTYDLSLPTPIAPPVLLEADGDNDGTYNETEDLNLFQTSGDTQALIRATIYDSNGATVSGSVVTFGADRPYKTSSSGASCSDTSTSCDVIFTSGNVRTSDSNGQAFVLVQVDPNILTDLTTTLNITATSDTGGSSMLTLFLQPVTVSSISIAASPTMIQTDAKSDIIAAVMTSAGTPAPEGTVVNFSANCGIFSPVGQLDPPFYELDATDLGKATSKLNAPSTPTTCEIKACVGSLCASTFVSVVPPPSTEPEPEPTPALVVVPGSATVIGGSSAEYEITGGVQPYDVFTSHPDITSFTEVNGIVITAADSVTVPNSGGRFTISNDGTVTEDTTVTITVRDNEGTTKTVTFKIEP